MTMSVTEVCPEYCHADCAQQRSTHWDRTMDLETLWARLCSGSARIVSHGSSVEAFHLVVDPSNDSDGKSREPRSLAILQALLLGTSRMLVAIECGLTQSTVTWAASRVLRTFGDAGGLRTVPVVLAAAAHAAAGVTELGQIVGTGSVVDRRHAMTFLLPRVETGVRGRLGAVEFAAVQLCLEGQTVVRAVAQTKMSPRAVNAGRGRAFRKLGVAGRLELISHLLRAQYGMPLRGVALSTSPRGATPPVPPPYPEACPHCTSKTGPFRDLRSAWLCRACARSFTTSSGPVLV